MIHHALRIAAAAALVLLPAVSARASGEIDNGAAPALRRLVEPGDKAPAFALDDLDGHRVSVNPGDGNPFLIVFFSAFCPLCRELAPSVRDIASRRGGRIRVVGVNLDGRRFSNAVRAFVNECGFAFPVLLDEIRNDMFLAADPYGVDKTPTAVLIDGRGSVHGSYAAEKMRDLVRDFDRIGAGLEEGNGVMK